MIATVQVVGGREFRADALDYEGGLWVATGHWVNRHAAGETVYAGTTIGLPPSRIREIRWERPRPSS